jgi:hypothetical protein
VPQRYVGARRRRDAALGMAWEVGGAHSPMKKPRRSGAVPMTSVPNPLLVPSATDRVCRLFRRRAVDRCRPIAKARDAVGNDFPTRRPSPPSGADSLVERLEPRGMPVPIGRAPVLGASRAARGAGGKIGGSARAGTARPYTRLWTFRPL